MSLKDLKNIVDGCKIPTTRYYMNKTDWDDIVKWGNKSEEEIIQEQMKEITTNAELRKYFISRLKDGRNLYILRRIVENNYPHYLEMLDKLLILR